MSTTATLTNTLPGTLHLRPQTPPSNSIEVIPLHDRFGAELRGIDFSKPLSDETIEAMKSAVGKYGVVVMRNTGLTDEEYVGIGERFGEIAPAESRRFPTKNLGDPSNIYLDGSIVMPGELRWFLSKETGLFHKDTTYDSRRARWTSIIAREIPPKGTGGATEFGDTRAVYDDLDDEMKKFLADKVGVHSHFHSRRVALPDFPTFKALDPWKYPMSKHDLVIDSLGSPGRKDLFIASHLHHIDGMDEAEGKALIKKLRSKVEEPQYVLKVYYDQPGDIVIWDNTAVVHRAGGNEGKGWAGKHRRDVRKWMAFDNSQQEWGRNARGTPKFLAGPVIQAKHDEIYGKDGKVFDFDEDP